MVMLFLARYRSMSWYFITQSISVEIRSRSSSRMASRERPHSSSTRSTVPVRIPRRSQKSTAFS